MSGALKIELGRRYRFSASHRLHSPHLTEKENCRVFGKCNNPHGHGHNYVLEVSMSGNVDPATGMIANISDLDAFVERQVLEVFDYKSLNEDFPAFENLPQGEARTHPRPGNRKQQLRVRGGQPRREPVVTKPTEEILLNDRKELDARSIACHVREIIKIIGEDPNREGLRKTPERFEKALKYLTSGYHLNIDHVLNGATFSVTYDEMVIVKDIEFFSLCEHHLLPFFGKAHVAYLPDKSDTLPRHLDRVTNTSTSERNIPTSATRRPGHHRDAAL